MSREAEPTPLPIDDFEVVKLVAGIGERLMISSYIDGVLGIYPDEAADLGAEMVGYAFSPHVMDRVRRAFRDPESVAASINALMADVEKRARQHQVGGAARQAEVYAQAFGLKKA